MIEVPQAAIDLAKRFEGFCRVPKSDPDRAYPYVCPAGFWTIGYGHLCDAKHLPITMEEGEAYLAADMADALRATLRFCPVLATEPEGRLAAIVDFTFNLGAGRLQASTLRRRVNQRDWPGAGQVMRRFEVNVFPQIGTRPVSEIQVPELVAMLKAIEARGVNDLAKRALQTSSQVFRYAIAHGLAERNPAADIKPSDVLASRKKQNLARIDGKELPELLRYIDAYKGAAITRLAMKLMAMTFVRTTELIGARWAEFDLELARWDIPAERMKMKTPHIVPLSAQAVNLLKTLHLITGHSMLLFPGERDHEKPMSNNTILKALDRMGYKGRMTAHGFRGVASTLLHEMGFDHAHIELQLAHQERDSVSAAYNHATYLTQRAKMMQNWSDYLDNCATGKVLAFKRAAG